MAVCECGFGALGVGSEDVFVRLIAFHAKASLMYRNLHPIPICMIIQGAK